MRFIYSQTVQQIKKPDGKKITAFKVLKGKNGIVREVKGITSKENNHLYNVHVDVKKLNRETGTIYRKHGQFKMKSSNILNLLKESNTKNLKDTSSIANSTKKVVASDTKKKSVKKATTTVDTKKKSVKKAVSSTKEKIF